MNRWLAQSSAMLLGLRRASVLRGCAFHYETKKYILSRKCAEPLWPHKDRKRYEAHSRLGRGRSLYFASGSGENVLALADGS